jgi:hypothetical protein
MSENDNNLSDVSVLYFGGSGGFFLLHLLMLSKKFFCSPLEDFESVFHKQWTIQDPARWKSSETWPNNAATAGAQTNLRKLFLHCNGGPGWDQHSGSKVLLYTDIETQLAMAEYKKAWCFHPDFVGTRDQTQVREAVIKDSVEIKGKLCWREVADKWTIANQTVYLQDIVSDCEVFLNSLNLEYTSQHAQFVDQWVNLHPVEIQKLLTRDSTVAK